MDTSRTVTNESANVSPGMKRDREALLRLEFLLEENSAFENSSSASKSVQNSGARSLLNPISTETAVARLGLMTGAIPTSALFLRLLFEGTGGSDPGAAVALTLIILISIATTSAAGYYSGKLTGRILSDLEEKPWPLMLIALPFVGTTWGLLSGAAGGFILLGIGSLFGGAVGALVGAAVLTLFGVLHRTVKEGDVIEQNKFLPISVGITTAIAAFILGI